MKKSEIKIGTELIVTKDHFIVFNRETTNDVSELVDNNKHIKKLRKSQLLESGILLRHMLAGEGFSYTNLKLSQHIRIEDLQKSLTPGHSDSNMFTFSVNGKFYSSTWSIIKDHTTLI